MKAEEYLRILTEQIRCKKARGAVGDEIKCHIADQKEVFMLEGMESEEAEIAAVKEMGDPVGVGITMDRIHRPKMAWGMILLVAFLSAAGYAVQYLLQSNMDGAEILPNNVTLYMSCIVIGFAIMMGVCILDYSRIGYSAKALMLFFFVAVFGAWLFFSVQIAGARAWIALGAITVNIKILLLLFCPLYGAVIYTYRGQGYAAFIKCIFWMIPPLVLAVLSISISTVATLMLTFAVILSVAVYRKWFRILGKVVLPVMWLCIIAIPAVCVMSVTANGAAYQKMRLQSYIDPSLREELGIIRNLFASSQWIGESAGSIHAGESLYGGSDYLLAHLVSYYGILAAAAIAGLIIYLFLRFMKISLNQKNQLGLLMGIGCSTVFIIQVVLYVLGNIGLFLVGTYCPFITYGGTGVIVTYILLGILLSIYRYQDVISDRPVKVTKKAHS